MLQYFYYVIYSIYFVDKYNKELNFVVRSTSLFLNRKRIKHEIKTNVDYIVKTYQKYFLKTDYLK